MLKPATSTTVGFRPACPCAQGDYEPDDFEIIETPLGERAGDDPSLLTGRAGYNRPRGANEGTRPITRYEQRRIAHQLRNSPHRRAMEDEAGCAFGHYIRTDRSGARPVPADLLTRWYERGWLEPVQVPAAAALPAGRGIVLDMFMGSGTTALVAQKHGRDYIGCDLNEDYVKLARERLAYHGDDARLVREQAAGVKQMGMFA